ncbi:DUF4886 domain-containing protein [Coraliomargarita parva]|uniref:DUF4886 domain-containing protein n=1 Tax=Coraliomargarita parva TaxID=3014050 RepID=UPI0022B3B07F|nr:hypothetical protein [Coraliomargarita parva]
MNPISHRLHSFVAACSFIAAAASPSVSHAGNVVLFIGNSFTIGPGGDITIPAIFDALANAGGHEDPTTVMCAEGGKDFQYHYESNQSYISQEPWTHVILQNFSTQPTHIGNVTEHMTYGSLLYDSIMANHGDTQVMLYMTWAEAEANSIITGTSTSTTFESTDEMLTELRTNYHALADELTEANPGKLPVRVNPVGDAWNNAGGNLPTTDPDFFDLFGSDNHHGNWYGYYLSACVHYSSIYGESPEGLYPISGLKSMGLNIYSDRAAFLEEVAWRTVVESGLLSQNIQIDFGAEANTTTSTLGDSWNNITSTEGSVDGTVLSGLSTSTGIATEIDLTIVSRFNSSDSSGTGVSALYPDTVSADSLYGNAATYNGESNLTPTIKLSGLEADSAYSFTFYASRAALGENLQTRYTVTGDRVYTVDLDVHDNEDTTTRTGILFPDASGEISIELAPGPDNDSAYDFTSLGALEVDVQPHSELLFTGQPSSLSVEANDTAVFTSSVQSTRSTQVQWYQDGVAIPGATEQSYTIAAATTDLNGSEYTVTVTNGVDSISSTAAILSVLDDLTAPTLLSLGIAGEFAVELTFSETMDAATVTDVSNFQIANRGSLIPVTAVSLSVDGLTATLTLASSVEGHVVLSASSNLLDANGNALADGTVITNAGSIGDSTIYIDFSGSYFVSGVSETWNTISPSASIRAAVGNGTGTPYEFTDDLLASTGISTHIGLVMVDAMTNTNSSGTSDSSAPYPEAAVVDAYYGHGDGLSFDNFVDNGQAVFVFTGLDAGKLYDFTFFASRADVSDNRETNYALSGANSASGDLDAANNITETLTLSGIVPDVSGEITLTVSVGASNNSSYYFYYLNALEIEVRDRDTPILFPPVSFNNGDWVVDWLGDGALWMSTDLAGSWTEVTPTPNPPYVDDGDPSGTCFYRLEY